MGVDRKRIAGRIVFYRKQKNIRLLEMNQRTGKRGKTKYWKKLHTAIRKLDIGCAIIDPMIKTHSGFDESNNADMQYVVEETEKLVAGTSCSLLLVHHTNKSGNADDASAIRGASAISNALRGGHTFYPMTGAEHGRIKPPLPKELYVRITGVKQNYAARIGARWLELVVSQVNDTDKSVGLRLCPPGFEKTPEEAFAEDGTTFDIKGEWPHFERLMANIRDGLPGGVRYTGGMRGPRKGSLRGLLADEFGLTSNQAKMYMAALMGQEFLIEKEYRPGKSSNRHKVMGLFAADEVPEDDLG
jgi:hypothetical protein